MKRKFCLRNWKRLSKNILPVSKILNLQLNQQQIKRGRKRKSDQAFKKKSESSSAMAELAASLQISHFHKVCELAHMYLVIRLIFNWCFTVKLVKLYFQL